MRPTSDQSKKAAGTFRPAVSRPPLGIPLALPQAPDWLSEGAKKEWDALVPDLQATGMLTRADAALVAALCSLRAEMAKDFASMSAGKLKELRMLSAEFGCSFSSRLKLKAPEGVAPSEPEKWTPKSEGNVVTIAGLRSSMRKTSAPGESMPVNTSDEPATDS